MFHCSSETCLYATGNFNRLIKHIWDKHSLESCFKHKCGISDCPRLFTNDQSFLRHVQKLHPWYFEKHMQIYNKVKNGQHNNTVTLQQEIYTGEEGHSNINVRETERETVELQVEGNDKIGNKENDDSDDAVSLGDCLEQVANFLLELREVFHSTTEAKSFVAKKVGKMLELDRKFLSHQIKKVLAKSGVPLSHEADMILDSENPFVRACSKFKGKKALSEYISKKSNYTEPLEIKINNDDSGKTYQYVPILQTLKMYLEHEDVLGEVLNNQSSLEWGEGRGSIIQLLEDIAMELLMLETNCFHQQVIILK